MIIFEFFQMTYSDLVTLIKGVIALTTVSIHIFVFTKVFLLEPVTVFKRGIWFLTFSMV